jgi:hypothetical protein
MTNSIPFASRMSEDEIEEARRRIEAQRSTVPADGNIGVQGAFERAHDGLRDATGHPLRGSLDETGPTGWPATWSDGS